MPDDFHEAHEDDLYASSQEDAVHEHAWQDTGFADLEDCPGCSSLRSRITGEVRTMPSNSTLDEAFRKPPT